MTPEQIEEMKRDRETGTQAWGYWNENLDSRKADSRRIARVPDMEAHILALTAEIDRLRAKVEAARRLADDAMRRCEDNEPISAHNLASGIFCVTAPED